MSAIGYGWQTVVCEHHARKVVASSRLLRAGRKHGKVYGCKVAEVVVSDDQAGLVQSIARDLLASINKL